MIATTDLAWLAELLEGEGSFGGDARIKLRIQLSMTDQDTVEKAARIAGVGSLYGPYAKRPDKPHHKPLYVWTVHRQDEAAGLMMTLLPFMSKRRTDRITSLLREWRKPTPHRTHCKNGHEVSPENTGSDRWYRCLPCKRERRQERAQQQL